MRIHAVPIALTVLLVAVSSGAQPSSVKAYSDRDASQVYAAMIPSPSNGKSMLIRSSTVRSEMCSASKEVIPDPEFREAMADFSNINKKVWDLKETIHGHAERLITQEEVESLFGIHGGGWREFYKKHPSASGFLSFSAVGFNRSRTVAVAYSEAVGDSLSGAGIFRYFRHTVKGWEEIEPDFPRCVLLERPRLIRLSRFGQDHHATGSASSKR